MADIHYNKLGSLLVLIWVVSIYFHILYLCISLYAYDYAQRNIYYEYILYL